MEWLLEECGRREREMEARENLREAPASAWELGGQAQTPSERPRKAAGLSNHFGLAELQTQPDFQLCTVYACIRRHSVPLQMQLPKDKLIT
jgi:hypothetical protein